MSIAIDRWNATQLANQLIGDGIEIVAFCQGIASMTWPSKKLEEVVLSGRLRHGGNPVLRWMAGNVSLETDGAGAGDGWRWSVLVARQWSAVLSPASQGIRQWKDGNVALIMAMERGMTDEAITGPFFIWDPRDGVTL